jgi:hypothetical protein
MNLAEREVRIMAIVLRSQRAGCAVLEGALGLLDWRIVYFEKNADARVVAAKKKIANLIHLHTPSVIVLCRTRLDQAHNARAVVSVVRAIKHEAAQRLIPVMTVKRAVVRDTFKDFGIRSRAGIAAMLATMFQELAPKLPPTRKIWHGEPAIMPMFDAVALAVAYWDHHNARQLESS